MSQVVRSRCPQCGAEAVPGQRFCPNCGMSMQASLNQAASALQPEIEQKFARKEQPGPLPRVPVSSGGQAHMESSRRSVEQIATATLVPMPLLEAVTGAQSGPDLSGQSTSDLGDQKAPDLSDVPTAQLSNGRKKISRRMLMLIPLLVLLVVVGGFASLLWYGNNVQPAITTKTLQTQMYYAGLIYQIKTVEQSQRFLNDPLPGQSGMMRVNMQVRNPLSQPVSVLYSESARLLFPGGKSQVPVTSSLNTLLKANGTQTGYLDFRVPAQTSLASLTLQLGRSEEAQVPIPLNGHADLKKYAPQKSALHAVLQYQGLNWTLVSASSELSREGQQAKQGMRYLTLTLNVDNPLAQMVIPGSPFDYMRLKVGNQSIAPQDTTLPVSFAAGVSGKSGEVTFLIPQNASTQTFILLAQTQNGFDQATQTLSIA
jgi:zinc-ribbon domain